MKSLTFLDWFVVASYFAGMVGIGLAVARKQENTHTYFLGGRTMPAWAVALSVLATSLSAATFIGAPQISYDGDLSYLILNIGGVAAGFVVAFVFIPPLYRAGTLTVYGYLGQRFGTPAMVAASGMFLLGRLLASGARLFMAAIAMALILYGDATLGQLVTAIIILGAVGTLYTVCGGIRAVIWTDAVQIVVVVFAAGLSMWLLLKTIPLSPGEIVDALRNAPGQDKLRVVHTDLRWDADFTVWTGVFAMTIFTTAAFSVDQDMVQRALTTRTAWHSGVAMVASQLLTVPVVMLFLAIGLLLSIYYGRPDLMADAAPADVVAESTRVYPQFLLNHMPTGARGLAMAGMFAAAMSSFDSAINAMASSVIGDLYLPLRGGTAESGKSLQAPRLAVAAMGVLLTAFAIGAAGLYSMGKENSLIGFALGVMAFALAPLLGVFCAALFTKRGNAWSAVAGLAAGLIAVLLIQPYPYMIPWWLGIRIAWPWYTTLAAPMSFLVCVLGTPAKRGTYGKGV